MKKTDDAIAKAKAILEKRREELQKEYDEAWRNHNDTGYEKYYNKMEKCEEDMSNISKILDAEHRVARAEYDYIRLKREHDIFLYKLDKLVEDYPGDEYVAQICDRVKGLLMSAEVSAKGC